MRDYFLRHRSLGLFLFVVISLAYLCGFYLTKEASILDNTIDKEDVYFKLDEYVRPRVGFEEFIPLFIKFDGGISSEKDLEKIVYWTKRAQEKFGGSVLSLANLPNYRRVDGGISHAPFIEPDLDNLDVERWKESVKKDPIYGILVERDFTWACIVIYLKPGYDEVEVFWDVAELVEEREIPKPKEFLKTFKLSSLERLWKSDIEPRDPSVMVSGWIIGRGTINRTLPIETFRLIGIGLFLSFMLFLLILRSWSQTGLATSMVLASIVWAWGSIGLIDILGIMEIRQRVYILAALTNCIVQGVSFGLHKFEELNRQGDWKSAQKVDPLISKTALVAIFGFMTLWLSFKLLSIRELGLISGLGVAYLLVMTRYFLPLVNVKPKAPNQTRAGALYLKSMQYLAGGLSRAAMVPARWHGFLLLFLFVFAAAGILKGGIIVGSTPLDYIPGKHSERTARYLNAPERIGCDALGLLVEPAETSENGLYLPRFIKSLSEFQREVLTEVKDARRGFSVVNTIEKISMGVYGKPLPETRAEVNVVFGVMAKSKLPEGVVEQSFFHNGARVTIFAPLNNSIKQAEFVEGVMEVARRYPDLRVSPFGKVPLYNREDRYIREGKPVNVFGSQWMIVVFCFFIILLKGRKLNSRMLSPWKGSLVMSTPFIFASSCISLLMIIFKIPLDVATAVITALAINASIDFSLYYTDAYQEALVSYDKKTAIRVAMMNEGTIIINDILLNAACFLPLSFSNYIPIKRLGWMMIVMIIACGLGSLVIMPSLLRWAIRRKSK
jgi:predicted RND superfamily exporter protein